jgi:hypothetical protein
MRDRSLKFVGAKRSAAQSCEEEKRLKGYHQAVFEQAPFSPIMEVPICTGLSTIKAARHG